MPENDAPLLYRIQDKRLVAASPDALPAEICFGIARWKPQQPCCKHLAATARFCLKFWPGTPPSLKAVLGWI